jgi:Putative esterase
VGLTSPILMYVLAALAAVVLASIIVDWRKLAGRSARSVIERTVSLVALQFLVLVLIFVVVNRSEEFYSSWADLFGLDTATGAVVASDGASPARILPIVMIRRTPVRVPGTQGAGGWLEQVTFNGQISGISEPGDVFLPAGYRASRHYPVIVDISDELTSTSSTYGAARLAETASRQIALGQLEPVIIVMVPASVSAADQGCLDAPPTTDPATGQAIPAIMAATFFTQDLPAAVEARYATSQTDASWALLGDRSGGYCALQLSMTNSWAFAAAAVPNGTYTKPPGEAANAGSRQLGQQQNLQWLLHNQPMQPVSVLFMGETSSRGAAGVFVAAARPPMHVSRLAVSGGWPLAAIVDWIGANIGPRGQLAQQGLGR